jgi:hypothetical protein
LQDLFAVALEPEIIELKISARSSMVKIKKPTQHTVFAAAPEPEI